MSKKLQKHIRYVFFLLSDCEKLNSPNFYNIAWKVTKNLKTWKFFENFAVILKHFSKKTADVFSKTPTVYRVQLLLNSYTFLIYEIVRKVYKKSI